MKCCANCFGDSFLNQHIENISSEVGDCPFCSAKDVKIVDPIDLRDYFELLRGIYAEDINGKPLAYWLQSDWYLFSKLEDKQCTELLSKIFDTTEVLDNHYMPVASDDNSPLDQWQSFRDELKHENRFFPKNTPDLDRLGQVLGYSTNLEETPPILYRARIMDGGIPYTLCEMGAPPHDLCSNGRANPAGIPYLYLASNINTAISEIRPHAGERVCVAEYKIIKKPILADLCNPRKTISPFSFGDDDISQLRNEVSFLCHLGNELARAVLPREAHLEYLPSQYLCEFIKHLGFDGVIYGSSVGEGANYALFNSKCVEGVSVKEYAVKCVTVEYALRS